MLPNTINQIRCDDNVKCIISFICNHVNSRLFHNLIWIALFFARNDISLVILVADIASAFEDEGKKLDTIKATANIIFGFGSNKAAMPMIEKPMRRVQIAKILLDLSLIALFEK